MSQVDPPHNVLLVHPNFPGQFRHLATHWAARPDIRLVALGGEQAPGLPGLRHLAYRAPADKTLGHPYLRPMERAVRTGQAATRGYLELKRRGFTPDVVLAHPGWGDTLYIRDIFPDGSVMQLLHLSRSRSKTQQSRGGIASAFSNKPATYVASPDDARRHGDRRRKHRRALPCAAIRRQSAILPSYE